MDLIRSAQSVILLVLGIAALGCEVWALVDAVRRRPDAFTAAEKWTKKMWVVVLAVAVALGVVTVLDVVALLGVVAFVAAAVYLVDVRPALDRVMGKGNRSGNGPYGPW